MESGLEDRVRFALQDRVVSDLCSAISIAERSADSRQKNKWLFSQSVSLMRMIQPVSKDGLLTSRADLESSLKAYAKRRFDTLRYYDPSISFDDMGDVVRVVGDMHELVSVRTREEFRSVGEVVMSAAGSKHDFKDVVDDKYRVSRAFGSTDVHLRWLSYVCDKIFYIFRGVKQVSEVFTSGSGVLNRVKVAAASSCIRLKYGIDVDFSTLSADCASVSKAIVWNYAQAEKNLVLLRYHPR
jgi:hypothetical protein